MARHMKQRKRAKSPLAHLYRAYKRSQSARSQNTDVAAVLGWLSQALDPHRPNDAHAQPTATGSTSRVRRQRTVLPNSASDEEDDDCDTDYRDEAGSGSATSSDGDETDSASDDESDDADTVEALESGDEDEDHHTRPQTTRSKLLFAAAELVAHDRPRKAPLPVTLMTPEEAKAAAAERLVKERLAGRYGGTTTGDTSDYDDEEALPAGNDVTALLEQAAANGAPENYLRAVERANKYLRESVARMKKRRIKRANRAIRATDGTFGDKSWLQEPFACHHCTPEWKANTKSKRPDMDLRHHYQSVHNYSWRKNTRRRWNWIPDDCLLPEDELEVSTFSLPLAFTAVKKGTDAAPVCPPTALRVLLPVWVQDRSTQTGIGQSNDDPICSRGHPSSRRLEPASRPPARRAGPDRGHSRRPPHLQTQHASPKLPPPQRCCPSRSVC